MRTLSLTLTTASVAAVGACAGLVLALLPAASASAVPSATTKSSTSVPAQSTTAATLKQGSRGAAVTDYQKKLNKAVMLRHLFTRPVPVTGYFGALTRKATLDLQAQTELQRDGKAGRQTRRALASLLVTVNKGALRVTLRPDGLGFQDGSGSTSAVTFRTDAKNAQTAVTRALGAVTGRYIDDCGNALVDYRGIRLVLSDGRFAGWETRSYDVRTAVGTGVGTTVADLRREGTVAFDRIPGFAGAAFTSGSDIGYVTGTKTSDRITSLRAGAACLAH